MLHYCSNSAMQAKCIGEWGDDWNISWGLFHEAIPVFNSDLSMSQMKENVRNALALGHYELDA